MRAIGGDGGDMLGQFATLFGHCASNLQVVMKEGGLGSLAKLAQLNSMQLPVGRKMQEGEND
jgi:hypothetical protein